MTSAMPEALAGMDMDMITAIPEELVEVDWANVPTEAMMRCCGFQEAPLSLLARLRLLVKVIHICQKTW